MRRGRVPELGLLLLAYQLFKNIGLTNIPPVSLLAILGQVGVYLQLVVVPRLCLSGTSVWYDGDYMRLWVPAFRHTNDIHLYYNMVSLAWKGLEMERRLGSFKYLVTLAVLVVTSSSIYVLLAVLGSDLLENNALINQCAIGFSGVLFAMKVVNIHHGHLEEERQSYFGFLVPLRYAVWLELVIIQAIVPNSSFLGHLAGILAGCLLVKTPLASVLGLQPPGRHQTAVRRGRSVSLLPSSPLTLGLCGLQVCLHLGLVPGTPPLTGCVRPTFNLVDRTNLVHLATSGLRHLSPVHLAISLTSLLSKGRVLEPRLGPGRFLVTVVVSVVASTFTHLTLSLLASHLSLSPPPGCVSGLTAPLFCLKVLALRHLTGRHTNTVIFELAELLMLVEPNTRLYHISGLVTGIFLLVFCSRLTGDSQVFSGPGHRLGGGAQPAWTRSWGYAGYEEEEERYQEEYQEALRRSRESYQYEQGSHSFTPTAPPQEMEEGELGEDGLVPDLVRQRPPLYAQEAAPPPPGQAYRISQPERFS